METFSFLSAPLLGGLGLASIPIIIHLLFRRRFRQIDWAPMKYLKLSIKRNRRRIRLEQLLLLLLRTALVVLLFLMVARPVMHAQGLGGWLGGRSRANQLILIDDSLSMGYQQRGRSALDRGKELAREILKTVGPKDRFTLVAASRPHAPLLREVELVDRTLVDNAIGDLTASDCFVAWETVLPALDELLTTSTYPMQEATIITDLRRPGWDEKVREAATAFRAKRVNVRVFDVGTSASENVALVALEPTERVALVGVAQTYEATIRNDSSRQSEGLEATFTVDGKPGVVQLPEIARGQTARVPLTATFQEPGLHQVSFRLPADSLPGDDARYLVTEVHQKLRAVVIDGEPSTDPLAGEADFFSLALALGATDADTWQVDLLTDSEWASTSFTQPDLIVLANVARVTPAQVAQLERFVKAGAGLMIFPGEQVDPDNYNSALYKDGQGLLPLPLVTMNEDKAEGLLLEETPRSPLAAMAQLTPAVLQRIGVRKFMQVKLPEANDEVAKAAGVRVLARWNSAESAPAAVARVFGRGEVLLWTMTADKGWTDWPTDPSYVLAMREAARGVLRGDSTAREILAGERLKYEPSATEISAPQIEPPGAASPVPMQLITAGGEAQPGQPDAAAKPAPSTSIVYDDTRRAGLYRATWQVPQKGTQSEWFAVEPDTRESELSRVTADELRPLLGSLKAEVIEAFEGTDVPIAVRGREIWRSLASCLLAMLIVEAGFATWAGRQH